jgi:hypothetical protein
VKSGPSRVAAIRAYAERRERETTRASPCWWVLTFTDDAGDHLGTIISRGRSDVEAIKRTHVRGINPGGEVCCYTVPMAGDPPEDTGNRLFVDVDEAAAVLREWRAREAS